MNRIVTVGFLIAAALLLFSECAIMLFPFLPSCTCLLLSESNFSSAPPFLGSASVLFLFSLLMIFAIKEFGVINKTYKIEFFFVCAFLVLFENIIFGEKNFREIQVYLTSIIFILGGLLRLVAAFKKKK